MLPIIMTVLILGAIEASLNGKLSLEFAMAGTWRNPFKFEYLALANLNLAIGISVGAGGVLPTFRMCHYYLTFMFEVRSLILIPFNMDDCNRYLLI